MSFLKRETFEKNYMLKRSTVYSTGHNNFFVGSDYLYIKKIKLI